jgi:hypothetical protein
VAAEVEIIKAQQAAAVAAVLVAIEQTQDYL